MDVRDGEGAWDGSPRGGLTGPVLRVSQVLGPITALGPGRRLGVWVQGCPLACAGCMSRHTWDPRGGQDVTVERLVRHWCRGLDDGYAGLTVSGGEPLEQPGPLGALLTAADRVRREAGREDDADLLVYTGWEEAEIAASPEAGAALDRADAVITGRYRAGEPTGLVWRGSANQRLVPRTPLGHRRYAPHLDRRSERPDLQLRVTDEAVHIVGVPRPGELGSLERDLAERGVTFRGNTWRP
ncbi:4Fe-4S single cluster domain-containing protein [Streptomyces phaeochromogenes]|uniref:4Fe-4S single cluster domain-containing protein n=1 Tax=Streptomyces phaeochromogenes TaxID=1923 RepID=UPI0038630D9A|nr:radical SAM protein [Streptomyces phaeochromogenes]